LKEFKDFPEFLIDLRKRGGKSYEVQLYLATKNATYI